MKELTKRARVCRVCVVCVSCVCRVCVVCVVCVVCHYSEQPATQIFNLFDDLMILKSGQVVYHGPADQVVDHYAQAGFPCPMHTNPADHIRT